MPELKCEHKETTLTPIALLKFEKGKVLYKYKEKCKDCGQDLGYTNLSWDNNKEVEVLNNEM